MLTLKEASSIKKIKEIGINPETIPVQRAPLSLSVAKKEDGSQLLKSQVSTSPGDTPR
jgi:hypothetical protein